jgi:hypothetical protein
MEAGEAEHGAKRPRAEQPGFLAAIRGGKPRAALPSAAAASFYGRLPFVPSQPSSSGPPAEQLPSRGAAEQRDEPEASTSGRLAPPARPVRGPVLVRGCAPRAEFATQREAFDFRARQGAALASELR